jgi:thioredoxin 1
MITPILEQISSEMAGKIKVTKMNIDENPNIPSNLGIRSIPTMIIFKAGKQVSTKVGLSPKESIEAWIEESI